MSFFPNLLPYADWGLLALRLAIGVVFLYHGWQKIKNAKQMAGGIGWPEPAVIVLGLVESLSGIALIFGIYTQLAALLLAIVMVGAWYYKAAKWHIPFSTMDKMGWEYDLVLLAGNLAILLGDGGTIGLF